MNWQFVPVKRLSRKPADPRKVIVKPMAPPLKLMDRIPETDVKSLEKNCLQEMLSVVSCLKENDFDNKFCPKELEIFQKCFETYKIEKKAFKEQDRKGILLPYAKNFTPRQVNKYLKRFPNV